MELDLEYFKGEFELAPGAVVHAGASYCQEAVVYQHSGFEPVFWIEALADVALHGARNSQIFQIRKFSMELYILLTTIKSLSTELQMRRRVHQSSI